MRKGCFVCSLLVAWISTMGVLVGEPPGRSAAEPAWQSPRESARSIEPEGIPAERIVGGSPERAASAPAEPIVRISVEQAVAEPPPEPRALSAAAVAEAPAVAAPVAEAAANVASASVPFEPEAAAPAPVPLQDRPEYTLGGMRRGPLGCRGTYWNEHLKPWLQETHWGYADLFEGVPFGARFRAHMCTQMANGTAARLVLYRYDFCNACAADAHKLNPHGYERLNQMAAILQACPMYPVVIEPVPGSPKLDQARRDQVAKLLEKSNIPASVVVGRPEMRGLAAEEALEIHQNMLRETQAGGAGVSATQSGGGYGAAGAAMGTSMGAAAGGSSGRAR